MSTDVPIVLYGDAERFGVAHHLSSPLGMLVGRTWMRPRELAQLTDLPVPPPGGM